MLLQIFKEKFLFSFPFFTNVNSVKHFNSIVSGLIGILKAKNITYRLFYARSTQNLAIQEWSSLLKYAGEGSI